MSSSSSSGCGNQCLYLTPIEQAALLAQGWEFIGGPFASEEECVAACCSGTSSTSSGCNVMECAACDAGASNNWGFTLSTIADCPACCGGSSPYCCSNCEDMNGTWCMTYESGCKWSCPMAELVCLFSNIPLTIQLTAIFQYLSGPDVWRLTFSGGEFDYYYEVAGSEFDCCDGGVLTRSSCCDSHCTGYPTTLAITPC